jgi:hypothetical protein
VLGIEIFNYVRFDQLNGRSAVVALTAVLSITVVPADAGCQGDKTAVLSVTMQERSVQ